MGKSTWGRVQNCFRHEIPVVFSQWSLVDSIHFSQQIVLPNREAYLSLGEIFIGGQPCRNRNK